MPRSNRPVRIKLPSGEFVCKAHNLVICGICNVHYSFMDEIPARHEEETHQLEGEPSAGSPGDILQSFKNLELSEQLEDVNPNPSTLNPSKFKPPSPTETPESLFEIITKEDPVTKQGVAMGGGSILANPVSHTRFVRRTDPSEILIYTSGWCPKKNAPAGCGVVFHPPQTPRDLEPKSKLDGAFFFRLENHGPAGVLQPPTDLRAHLRAVIAALQFRVWTAEGWKRLVIATHDQRILDGATGWIDRWESNKWRTGPRFTRTGQKSRTKPIRNRDLWELLGIEVRKCAERGCAVLFWKIPRKMNKAADKAVREAAEMPEVPRFSRLCGVMVKQGEMALYSV